MMDQNCALLLSWHLGNLEIPTSDWGKVISMKVWLDCFCSETWILSPKLPKKCQNQSSWTQHLTFLAAFQADVLQLSPMWAGTLYLGSTHYTDFSSKWRQQIFIFIFMWISDLAEFSMQIFLITFITFRTPDKKPHLNSFCGFYFNLFLFLIFLF